MLPSSDLNMKHHTRAVLYGAVLRDRNVYFRAEIIDQQQTLAVDITMR